MAKLARGTNFTSMPSHVTGSGRGSRFCVVPRARWHAPGMLTGFAGVLDRQTAADNESNQDNNRE
jgi:hypothetical protein